MHDEVHIAAAYMTSESIPPDSLNLTVALHIATGSADRTSLALVADSLSNGVRKPEHMRAPVGAAQVQCILLWRSDPQHTLD